MTPTLQGCLEVVTRGDAEPRGTRAVVQGTRWEFTFAYDKLLYDLLLGGADIRPLVPRRGVPRQVSFDTQWAYYYRIGACHDATLRYVAVGMALRWLRSGRSHLHPDDEWLISDPHAYFPTWLTAPELRRICIYAEGQEPSAMHAQLRSLMATMQALDARPRSWSRLVLWFVG